MNTVIEIPRDNPKNEGICQDIENLVLDTIAADPNDAWHVKELTSLAHRRLGHKYTGDFGNHVMHACDQFFANRLIKRVAPSVFQAIEGPDDEFSDRMSGYVPENEPYAKRPKNYNKCDNTPAAHARAIFNRQVRDALVSVKILLTCRTKFTGQQMLDLLMKGSSNPNPVAVKVAIKEMGLTI